MAKKFGFVTREYVNLGEAPYKNVGKAVVTQARLAEPLRVLAQRDGWCEVEMADTYTGWVSSADVVLVDEVLWEAYQAAPQVLVTAHFAFVYEEPSLAPHCMCAKTVRAAVTMGTELRLLGEVGEVYQVLLPGSEVGFIAKSDGRVVPRFNSIPLGDGAAIVRLAQEFLGLPYFWGGTTPYGYDCSGFVQTVLKMHGVHLRRDAHMQYEQGVAVEREALAVGDLVFWSTYKPGASHVGFYMGDSRYIHAGSSRGVAINSFDPAHDDYSEELDKKYLGARRVLGVLR